MHIHLKHYGTLQNTEQGRFFTILRFLHFGDNKDEPQKKEGKYNQL